MKLSLLTYKADLRTKYWRRQTVTEIYQSDFHLELQPDIGEVTRQSLLFFDSIGLNANGFLTGLR